MTNPLIETFTGKRIDPLWPKASDIAIEDIAHGLAMQCRFNGQCADFYSIAQHAILVEYLAARIAASEHPNLREFRWGVSVLALHHDSAEAYVGDIIRPIRAVLWGGFEGIHDRFAAAILAAFGVDATHYPSAQWIVRAADDQALALEARHLMHSAGEGWPIVPVSDNWVGPFTCDPPAIARAAFLARHEALMSERKPI